MNYRNNKLLKLAEKVKVCTHCGLWNEGRIVAAHSNLLKHGKGRGLKSNDIPAYLCPVCHDILDGRVGDMDKQGKELMFLNAMFKSMLWLLESGHLEVKP
jgi:hypothetical protein